MVIIIMKEIPFRWIDKYLIHLKIQEKFYLLFILPLLALVILTLVLNSAANSLISGMYQEELMLMKGGHTIGTDNRLSGFGDVVTRCRSVAVS